MSRVVVTDLVKQWETARAVDGISIDAAQGQLLALLGPSGCGKSTTLRLIAGLEDATSGKIEIGGRDVTRLPAAQRNLSMVFQSYALFPHLSVAENIIFGLKVRGVASAQRRQRLNKVAEMLGLSALLDRKPAQLSGGQRQRIALGRAIIAEAPVCLMDEPLSNLDAQLRHQMRNEIRALQQRLGITMIYVTHDQTEAMTMADRIVLMRGGRIEQQGTPAELYEQPANTFVAGFLGAPPMNLLPADLLPGLSRPATGKLLLGVRPEHVRVTSLVAGVHARVEQIEYLGAETLLTCRPINGSTTDEANPLARLTARIPGAPRAQVGDVLGLAWDTTDQRFFDATDGRHLPDSGVC